VDVRLPSFGGRSYSNRRSEGLAVPTSAGTMPPVIRHDWLAIEDTIGGIATIGPICSIGGGPIVAMCTGDMRNIMGQLCLLDTIGYLRRLYCGSFDNWNSYNRWWVNNRYLFSLTYLFYHTYLAYYTYYDYSTY